MQQRIVACQHIWNGTEWVPSTGSAASGGSTDVSVSNFPASQPVTGTFWQATQPVSLASVPSHAVTGPLTDAELRASAVPVSASTTVAVSSVGGQVRAWVPDCTAVSGQAGAAGDNTILSSNSQGIYVYAFSWTPISSAANLCRWLRGSTSEAWRARVVAPSTIGDQGWGHHLAVTPPGYLFRTATGQALLLNVVSSGISYSVAVWREG